MKFGLVVLWWIASHAEKPQVNNAFHCNYEDDPKKNHACRKNRAGGLYCSDRSRCRVADVPTRTQVHPTTGKAIDVHYCPDDEAARRVGMTCNTFPFYNGGYPMLAGGMKFDWEWEDYRCTRTNGTVCTEWSSHEDSPVEYEVGTYTCDSLKQTATGFRYCQSWSSVQRETKKCVDAYDCSPNCGQPTFCHKQCCGDNSCYDCSYTPLTEYEYSTATCTQVNDYGACLSWTQEEYDQHNLHFREYETYQCVDLSTNLEYRRRWIGDIDSEEEFEISTCQCLDDDTEDRHYCRNWVCYETGYSYFFPNLVWVLLPILIGAVFVCCFLNCMAKDCDGFIPYEHRFWLYIYLLTIPVALNIVAAHLAGFTSVLIVTGTTVILYPLIFCGFQQSRERKSRAQADTGTPKQRPEGPTYGMAEKYQGAFVVDIFKSAHS